MGVLVLQSLNTDASVLMTRTLARLSTFVFSEADALSVGACLTREEILVTLKGKRSDSQLHKSLSLWRRDVSLWRRDGVVAQEPHALIAPPCAPHGVMPFTTAPRKNISVFMTISRDLLAVYGTALGWKSSSDRAHKDDTDALISALKKRVLEWQAWHPEGALTHHEAQL